MNHKATIWEDGIRDMFMCNKLTLNFTFTENKSHLFSFSLFCTLSRFIAFFQR